MADKNKEELWKEKVVSYIEWLAEYYAEDIDDDMDEEDLYMTISDKLHEDGDRTSDIVSLVCTRIKLMREEE